MKYLNRKKIAKIILTSANVGGITDEPVSPVEEGSLWRARMWPHGRHERLDEAEHCGGETERGVIRGRAPGLQLDDDYHEAADRHRPRQQHEESMPLGGRIRKLLFYRYDLELFFLRKIRNCFSIQNECNRYTRGYRHAFKHFINFASLGVSNKSRSRKKREHTAVQMKLS